MILENQFVQHSRLSFTGKRKLLAALLQDEKWNAQCENTVDGLSDGSKSLDGKDDFIVLFFNEKLCSLP